MHGYPKAVCGSPEKRISCKLWYFNDVSTLQWITRMLKFLVWQHGIQSMPAASDLLCVSNTPSAILLCFLITSATKDISIQRQHICRRKPGGDTNTGCIIVKKVFPLKYLKLNHKNGLTYCLKNFSWIVFFSAWLWCHNVQRLLQYFVSGLTFN